MRTLSSSVKTTGIFIAFSLFLLAGCTLNCKNSSQKGSFICKKEPFDSLIIHFNYGESAPDTIVEWALYKNGDLKRRISYGGEYAGDSCKIQVVKGEKQQTIQHLAHELFIVHSCPDIIKTRSKRVVSDCGEYCVNVYSPGKTVYYNYDFGYDVEYSHELLGLIKLTAPLEYVRTIE